MSTDQHKPLALALAARPYLNELRQAVDQSGIHVLGAEFERAVCLAVEHQPDIILVASPPIEDALQTCRHLLENYSSRNIPISLISLDCNMIDTPFTETPALATAGETPYRQFAADYKEGLADAQPTNDDKRTTRLLSVVNLLRYVEVEIVELKLETSAVLLEAMIVDLAQSLD